MKTETKIKTNTVVIMDGTDKRKVEYVRSLCEAWSPIAVGKPMVWPLSKDHPSMIVIKTQLNDYEVDHVNGIIEKQFPGLCMFNPPMAV